MHWLPILGCSYHVLVNVKQFLTAFDRYYSWYVLPWTRPFPYFNVDITFDITIEKRDFFVFAGIDGFSKCLKEQCIITYSQKGLKLNFACM